ncbi:hypothetical protein B0H34DRAFT_857339 [Crassisporium funariophilum]|nr:hypothetical protein B0H34DRAFT_857339 [Crassisporium funariophilum]
MSHSTTGTATYVLSKYSRSYPVKRTSLAQHGQEISSDWQHFTNPVIRLVLDVKKANTTELESVRLRILWQMDCVIDGSNNSDVEDIDLLSFSSLGSVTHRKQPLEGLPLKAVYRDTVVGIRYLHSRDDAAASIYRRFQISFSSASEATDFINSIRPVCPCKVNPTNIPGAGLSHAQSLIPSRPTIGKHSANACAAKSILPNRGSPLIVSTSQSVSAWTNTTQVPKHVSKPPVLPLSSSPLSCQPWSDPVSSTCLDDFASSPNASSGPVTFQPARQSVANHDDSKRPWLPAVDPCGDPPTFPHSSLPMPSSAARSSEGPSSGTGRNLVIQKDAIMECVMDSIEPSIYAMSPEKLEKVIGEIIREDGFIGLVRFSLKAYPDSLYPFSRLNKYLQCGRSRLPLTV